MFSEWRKRSKLLDDAYRNMWFNDWNIAYNIARAAYKAGVRAGIKQEQARRKK